MALRRLPTVFPVGLESSPATPCTDFHQHQMHPSISQSQYKKQRTTQHFTDKSTLCHILPTHSIATPNYRMLRLPTARTRLFAIPLGRQSSLEESSVKPNVSSEGSTELTRRSLLWMGRRKRSQPMKPRTIGPALKPNFHKTSSSYNFSNNWARISSRTSLHQLAYPLSRNCAGPEDPTGFVR